MKKLVGKSIALGDGTFVATELGGIGESFWYYVVLSSKYEILEEQRNLIKISLSLVNKKFKTSVEEIKFKKKYLIFKILIPIYNSVDEIVMDIIKISNSQKQILRKHYLCDNTAKPKLKDIKLYLSELE
jgi:hypothetical protein